MTYATHYTQARIGLDGKLTRGMYSRGDACENRELARQYGGLPTPLRAGEVSALVRVETVREPDGSWRLVRETLLEILSAAASEDEE